MTNDLPIVLVNLQLAKFPALSIQEKALLNQAQKLFKDGYCSAPR